MALTGFDPRWRDVPHYILGITREIWEDRGIATLHRHYAPDIVVRSPASVVTGNAGVIGATMATLHEFPDRTLLGEDVIWSGEPETGMLSSHRLLSTATHLGDGAYGRATGRRLTWRIIADCHARNGVIDDEWLIRDQGAIVRQMGLSPEDHARARLAAGAPPPLTPDTDIPGPYRGRGNDDEWGQRHEALLRRIMAADFATIPRDYDRAVRLDSPGGATGHGWGAVDALWLGLRAAFPDAAFTVHHRIGRADDPLMPPRSALRWSLHDTHSGWGAFGPPSGATVYVLGLSHAEWGPRGLRREVTLWDETAIWQQILMHRGAADLPREG
jgi:hypothetical protein